MRIRAQRALLVVVVEQTDDEEAVAVLGSRLVLRIPRKDIVLNQQHMRWECNANNASQSGGGAGSQVDDIGPFASFAVDC